MERKGFPVMWLVIAALIFLVVAMVVLGAFSGNFGVFDSLVGENIHSSDRDLCATKVENFCADNPEASWGDRYPGCREFSGSIDDGQNTDCPVSE